ncbi:class I SAM-dependent methyltransferase [Nannocystaceae bacterium ST9]
MSEPPEPSEPTRRYRRARFDDIADRYAEHRPSYPDALFDDVWALAGLGDAPELLEIGCGTGQATRSVLARGARVLAIELGERMAALAREATRDQGERATIVSADFDRWTPPTRFDLVLAATSFHWLDPTTRCPRVASALREHGCLAILSHESIADERDEFFVRSRAAYAEAFGEQLVALPTIDQLEPFALDPTIFEAIVFRTYRWTRTYDTEAYLALLATFSDHRELPESSRARLFSQIAAIVDEGLGGRFERHWAACLTLARVRGTA